MKNAHWKLAVSLLLLQVVAPVTLRAETPEPGGEDLRVLTYNIHMWEPGVDGLASVIKAADADIVGLNEAWNGERNEELAKKLGYHVVYDGQKDWKVTPFLESKGFSDLFRSLHPDPQKDPGLTCGDGRIDYIFHNRLVRPVECRVVGNGIFGSKGYKQSDHLGVFGVVRIGEKPSISGSRKPMTRGATPSASSLGNSAFAGPSPLTLCHNQLEVNGARYKI